AVEGLESLELIDAHDDRRRLAVFVGIDPGVRVERDADRRRLWSAGAAGKHEGRCREPLPDRPSRQRHCLFPQYSLERLRAYSSCPCANASAITWRATLSMLRLIFSWLSVNASSLPLRGPRPRMRKPPPSSASRVMASGDSRSKMSLIARCMAD